MMPLPVENSDFSDSCGWVNAAEEPNECRNWLMESEELRGDLYSGSWLSVNVGQESCFPGLPTALDCLQSRLSKTAGRATSPLES
jgi:hypothetical protein